MLLKRLAYCFPLLGCLMLWPPAALAGAGEEQPDCLGCHADVEPHSTAHEGFDCGFCHTNVATAAADHPGPELGKLSGDAVCAQCHGDIDQQLAHSVHGELVGCVDCHGPPHAIPLNSEPASPVSTFGQIKTCGTCHAGDDGLVEAYRNSIHGRGVLLSGLVNSATCSNCHGAHGILAVSDPQAPTSRKHSPEMCGQCHVGVLDRWLKDSAHGQAWAKGSTAGPVCTSCHHSHDIEDPTRGHTRQVIPDNCGNCHGELYSSYRLTFHGKSTQLGMLKGAVCSDCHTPHANLPVDDPRSSINPAHRRETCGKCHQGVPDAFLDIDMHNDPRDPADNAYVYYVYLFMTGLLVFVFAFFAVHDLLWLQRIVVGMLRGEYRPPGFGRQDAQYVRRFRRTYIVMHIVVITTFLTLAMTGLPLKFHDSPWAQTLMNLLGGVGAAGTLHRIAALGTFGYMVAHIFHLTYRMVVKGERGLFWGPNSLVPQWQDVKDFGRNVRYFLYMGPRPPGDRWTYWEKFDYFAVFWGVMMIGLSGLMLWFPAFFTRFLPGWAINAALVVHSDEALLATGFIFVFHFFHTHLRPESFPMDPVVFTGRMTLERLREERPLEYQRMLDEGTLEEAMTNPPSREEMAWAYVFGFLALGTGLVLAVGIFWALLAA